MQVLEDRFAISTGGQPMTTPPSPAAQAIVTAFNDRYELLGPLEDNWQELCIAAALHAAAHHLTHDRRQLRAIATELDPTP
jgi:hypothetical protein